MSRRPGAGHRRSTHRRLDRLGPTLITLALAALACQPQATADASPEARPPEGRPPEYPTAQTQAPQAPAPQREDPSTLKVEQLTVEVVAVYPHDPTAFTQGLVWDGGVLYESTGLYGRSTVRRVDPSDGRILDKTFLDPNLFGEGMALAGGRLIQLTWKAGVAVVYELVNLQPIDQFGYNGEGWGLAFDGERLAMSNGSSLVSFRDPVDFRWLSTLEVRLAGEPIDRLNELEFAAGALYANIWGENRIVRIDPGSGRVSGVIDAEGLLSPQESRMVDVLNGIAYDPMSETFWLTGKFWPRMFQVVFVPKPGG